MQMTFYSSDQVTLLWAGWVTSGACSYWLSLLALFVSGVFYEGLTVIRSKVDSQPKPARVSENVSLLEDESVRWSDDHKYPIDGGLINQDIHHHHHHQQPDTSSSLRHRFRKEFRHLLRAILFFFQLFFGYLIMLAVMTYNYGVFFSIILGRALGYYLLIRFHFTKHIPPEDVCH